MRRLAALTAGLIIATMAAGPAAACRLTAPIDLADLRNADMVVVGRIASYRTVRDEKGRAERQKRLPGMAKDAGFVGDYARFDILVDEVLAGKAPRTLSVTWDAGMFGEPETMPPGPFVIALRRPKAALPTVMQRPCSNPFLAATGTHDAAGIRRALKR